jgi:hypothetical protein
MVVVGEKFVSFSDYGGIGGGDVAEPSDCQRSAVVPYGGLPHPAVSGEASDSRLAAGGSAAEIFVVLLVGCQAKVLRLHARPVVAYVVYLHALGNWAVVPLVAEPVNEDALAAVEEGSVAMFRDIAGPNDAFP